MTATVHDLSVFRSAKRYGPNMYRAVRDRILADQKAGLSGRVALHELFELKRRGLLPKEPA